MRKNFTNLKNSGILLMAFMLISTIASADTYTATASGNWSSSATWGGSVPPTTITLDQVTIPSGITVTMDNDVTLNGALTVLTVQGTLSSASNVGLNITYGTLTGNGTIDVGSLVIGTGAAVTFTGTLMVDTLTNAALNLQTAATVTVSQTVTLTSGVLAIQSGGTLTMGNNATIVLDGGTLAVNGGTLGLTANYNVHYKTSSAVAGLELSGSGLNNLVVEVGAGNTLTLASNLTVNGMLILTSGTLVIGSNNLVLNGDVSSTASGSVKSSNADITFNSTSGLSGTLTFSGSSTVNNLTVNVGNLNKAQISGDLTVNGTLMLTSGTLQLSNSHLMLKGTISVTGSGNIFSTSTSSITVNTTSSPLGTLSFASGGSTVNNLTVNIGGTGTLVLGSDLTVDGTLYLTSGRLDIGNYKLTVMTNSSITGASSSSYIVTGTTGTLSLAISTLDISGVMFPVGTSTTYLPATVKLNIGSGSGQVNIGVINNVYAQGTTGADLSLTKRVVDATWMVSSDIASNLNMNLKLIWPTSAEVNGFTRTSAHISHYINNTWDVTANANATSEANGMFSLTRSNITTLSPFAVFDNTTGAVTAPIKTNISIAPNPGNDMITVSNITGTSKPVTMEIVNMTGQVVASYILDQQTNNISVSALNAGYYTVRLYNNEVNSTQRFIKN